MTAKVLPPAPSSEDVESSGYARLALLSGVCSWTLALARLGIALARHEVGVDPVLALVVAIGLPLVVLGITVRTRRHAEPALGLNDGAMVIPLPVRRTSQGRGAS